MRKWLALSFAIAWLAMPPQNAARAADADTVPVAGLVGPEDVSRPLFRLPGLDGQHRELARYRGRIVLVHFFATWCEPCRPEIERLQELRASLADQPFEVLAISVAEADSAVRRFFSAPPVLPVLLDRDRTVTKLWSISTLPTTVVLDHRLQARLIAEGDVDWGRADVRQTLGVLLKEASGQSEAGSR